MAELSSTLSPPTTPRTSPHPSPLSSRPSPLSPRPSPMSPHPVSFNASPTVPQTVIRPRASVAGELVTLFNQQPGECRWPIYSRAPKPCVFPEPVTEADGHTYVYLEPGTHLYHATVIMGNKPKWFENGGLHKEPKSYTWFASTPDHAKSMNWTHLLKYTVDTRLKLLFVQNMFTAHGIRKGHEYAKGPFLTVSRTIDVDGYAGCNECEFMIVHSSIKKISADPTVMEEREMRYINGGSRAHKHTRRCFCRKRKQRTLRRRRA